MGVSSSNQVTIETHSNDAKTAIRFTKGLSGRSSPLPKRLTEASELAATINDAPSARAYAR